MKKRATGKKKVRTEIWVALIGLAGVIVTAIFGSPVLIKLLERTPAPAALTEDADSSASGTSSNCKPAGLSELPAQAVVVIESRDGVKTTVPFRSLRYEYQTGLRLASGTSVDFNRMKRVNLFANR